MSEAREPIFLCVTFYYVRYSTLLHTHAHSRAPLRSVVARIYLLYVWLRSLSTSSLRAFSECWLRCLNVCIRVRVGPRAPYFFFCFSFCPCGACVRVSVCGFFVWKLPQYLYGPIVCYTRVHIIRNRQTINFASEKTIHRPQT